jgi:hypothetical protein
MYQPACWKIAASGVIGGRSCPITVRRYAVISTRNAVAPSNTSQGRSTSERRSGTASESH